MPNIVQNDQRSFVADDRLVTVDASEFGIIRGEIVAKRLADLTKSRDKVVRRLLTDRHPDNAVGKSLLDGFVVSERLREDRLADTAHPLQGGHGDTGSSFIDD